MVSMESHSFDLAFDPNDVGPDLVVECWDLAGTPRRMTRPSILDPATE